MSTVGDEQHRLVSPLPVKMVEGVLKLSWDSPVVLGSEDDEPGATGDECAPVAHGGRGVQGRVTDLDRHFRSVSDGPEGMWRAIRVNKDKVIRVGLNGLRRIETTLDDRCQPRCKTFVVAGSASTPKYERNFRHVEGSMVCWCMNFNTQSCGYVQ